MSFNIVSKCCIGCEAKMYLLVAPFELWTPASEANFPGDFDSRAGMSVRVWKGGFMVDTLGH